MKTGRAKCATKIPWMTPDLIESMRNRDFHLKQAHKTNSNYNWKKYRKVKIYLYKQVKLCKSNYYQNLINVNKDNPAGLWKSLNAITARDLPTTTPSCIISDDVPVNDKQSIATIMNECFITIGSKLANKIKEKFKPKTLQKMSILSGTFPNKLNLWKYNQNNIQREIHNLHSVLKVEHGTFTPLILRTNCGKCKMFFPYVMNNCFSRIFN